MTGWWGDVNARARGVGTRLPSGSQLQALAREASVPGLARGLAALGVAVGPPAATAAALDAGVRAWAAMRLTLLHRRMGPSRSRAARVILEEADRRAVRALLRGAVEGAPAPSRLTGVVPSLRLPPRRLDALARCDSVDELADRLVRIDHPAAAALRAAPSGTVPDLFRMELALDRTYAARALEGARRGGDLLAYVREEIDLRNAWSILAVAGGPDAGAASALHLAGGARISAARFRALCAADPEEARDGLAADFRDGPLAGLFRDTGNGVALERRALAARIRGWERRARSAPLGPAPFLAFALRLAAVTQDMCSLVWGCALGAPSDRRLPALERTA